MALGWNIEYQPMRKAGRIRVVHDQDEGLSVSWRVVPNDVRRNVVAVTRERRGDVAACTKCRTRQCERHGPLRGYANAPRWRRLVLGRVVAARRSEAGRASGPF